jgi:hypothetical protein
MVANPFPGSERKSAQSAQGVAARKIVQRGMGSRFRGEGIFAEQIARMFEVARRQAGFKPTSDQTELSTAAFRRPGGTQLSLFS